MAATQTDTDNAGGQTDDVTLTSNLANTFSPLTCYELIDKLSDKPGKIEFGKTHRCSKQHHPGENQLIGGVTVL